MMPEEFFQTLELEPDGVWVPARKIDGITYGSGVRIGDNGGSCVAKRGKYHIFTKIKGEPHIYWVAIYINQLLSLIRIVKSHRKSPSR